MQRYFAVILVKERLGELQDVYIDLDITTLSAEP